VPINGPRIQGKCLIASMSAGDEHGRHSRRTVLDPGRRKGPGLRRRMPGRRRSHQLLEHVMKRSILLLLLLAAALAGCVHPTDLDAIVPAPQTSPSAN
jgi:hypothetical protein